MDAASAASALMLKTDPGVERHDQRGRARDSVEAEAAAVAIDAAQHTGGLPFDSRPRRYRSEAIYSTANARIACKTRS